MISDAAAITVKLYQTKYFFTGCWLLVKVEGSSLPKRRIRKPNSDGSVFILEIQRGDQNVYYKLIA